MNRNYPKSVSFPLDESILSSRQAIIKGNDDANNRVYIGVSVNNREPFKVLYNFSKDNNFGDIVSGHAYIYSNTHVEYLLSVGGKIDYPITEIIHPINGGPCFKIPSLWLDREHGLFILDFTYCEDMTLCVNFLKETVLTAEE
jgi:hypothetical protein